MNRPTKTQAELGVCGVIIVAVLASDVLRHGWGDALATFIGVCVIVGLIQVALLLARRWGR